MDVEFGAIVVNGTPNIWTAATPFITPCFGLCSTLGSVRMAGFSPHFVGSPSSGLASLHVSGTTRNDQPIRCVVVLLASTILVVVTKGSSP